MIQRTLIARLAAGLLLGSTLAPNAFAKAPGGAGTRAGVAANYAAFNAAFKKKDLNGMWATLAPDFTLTMPGKTPMNSIQTRQVYAGLLGGMKSVDQVTQTIQTLHANGQGATTTVRMAVRFTTQDKKGTHHAVQTSTWRDTFVHNAAGWKLRKAINLTEKMMVDGHAVQG